VPIKNLGEGDEMSEPKKEKIKSASAESRHTGGRDATGDSRNAIGQVDEGYGKSVEEVLESETLFTAHLDSARAALREGRLTEAFGELLEARTMAGRERDGKALNLWNQLAQRSRRVGLRSSWHLRTFKGFTGSVNSVCRAVTADSPSRGAKTRRYGCGKWPLENVFVPTKATRREYRLCA